MRLALIVSMFVICAAIILSAPDIQEANIPNTDVDYMKITWDRSTTPVVLYLARGNNQGLLVYDNDRGQKANSYIQSPGLDWQGLCSLPEFESQGSAEVLIDCGQQKVISLDQTQEEKILNLMDEGTRSE